MCCCLGWPFKDVEYEAAPKYKTTTTGYRYQWNGQSWDLQEIQVPTVSSCCHFLCPHITGSSTRLFSCGTNIKSYRSFNYFQ